MWRRRIACYRSVSGAPAPSRHRNPHPERDAAMKRTTPLFPPGSHEYWMQLALDEAKRGAGSVAPNPMVGALLVAQGEEVARGYHHVYGGAHAEVELFRAIGNSSLPEDSTLYLTLEPCNHFGKTPPCTDLILRRAVRRVVVACSDAHPLVAGNGIARLRESGVLVTVGVLEDEAIWCNRRFFTAALRNRPYVVVKWAMTEDGFIARPDGSSKWISGEAARTLAHRWRVEEDLVVVGARTALADDPALTVRHVAGRNPWRAVIDDRGTLPETLQLFNGRAPTLLFTPQLRTLPPTVVQVPLDPSRSVATQLLAACRERQLSSVLLEGGAALQQRFLEAGVWDELRIVRAPKTFGRGIAAPVAPHALLRAEERVGEDVVQVWMNPTTEEFLRSLRTR